MFFISFFIRFCRNLGISKYLNLFKFKMYTEIRELVNYLAQHFHLRIPKLKVWLFLSFLKMFMVRLECFASIWPTIVCCAFSLIGTSTSQNNVSANLLMFSSISSPNLVEEHRIIRISRGYSDEVFSAAASAVGLLLEELLNLLPGFLFFII